MPKAAETQKSIPGPPIAVQICIHTTDLLIVTTIAVVTVHLDRRTSLQNDIEMHFNKNRLARQGERANIYRLFAQAKREKEGFDE